MRFTTTLNKNLGNSLNLQLQLGMRVRVREINENATCFYNGSLCIFRYDEKGEYQFIKNISVVEAYFTAKDVSEYIDKYFPLFGEKIRENFNADTLEKIEKTEKVDNDDSSDFFVSVE